jgi:hypothetical protein
LAGCRAFWTPQKELGKKPTEGQFKRQIPKMAGIRQILGAAEK